MAGTQAAAVKKKRKFFSVSTGFDMPFLIILMLILVVGLVCMYSASYAYAFYWYDGDSYYFIKRQLAFAVLGVVAMLVISTVDYHVLHRFAWIFWLGSLVLLGWRLSCRPRPAFIAGSAFPALGSSSPRSWRNSPLSSCSRISSPSTTKR